MPTLNLKPNHEAITAYYAALERYRQHGVTHETAVRAAFQALLEACARQLNWTMICEYTLRIPEGSRGTGPRATVPPSRRDLPVSMGSVSGQGCPSYRVSALRFGMLADEWGNFYASRAQIRRAF